MNQKKKQRKNQIKEENERCVVCGALTDVPKNLPVSQRYNYVEGAGQLCPHCAKLMN